MSFSDDRLRELKKDLARFGNIDVCNFFEDNGDIARLVTRLDAAERVIKASFDPEGMAYIGYDDWHECLAAWRKAKGEAPESDSERAGRVQE